MNVNPSTVSSSPGRYLSQQVPHAMSASVKEAHNSSSCTWADSRLISTKSCHTKTNLSRYFFNNPVLHTITSLLQGEADLEGGVGVRGQTFQSTFLGTSALPQVLLTVRLPTTSEDFPTVVRLPLVLLIVEESPILPRVFWSIYYFISYYIFPWHHFYYFSHCAIFHLFSPSSHLVIYKYIWQESSHLILFGHPVR